MKTIYHFDAKTGAFIQANQARESPLEEGVFLIPANATDIEPPKFGDNETAVFKDDAWSVVPDFRSVALWDTENGKPLEGVEVGKTPADLGATEIDPGEAPAKWTGASWELDVESVRAAKLTELQTGYKQDQFSAVVSYMGASFQADPDSQETLCKVLGAASAAGAVPDDFYWVDADNNRVPMNLTQLRGLAGAMMQQGWLAFKQLQASKAAARKSQTESGIKAIGL